MDIDTQAVDGHRWTTRCWPAATPTLGLLWIPALGVPAIKYERFALALAGRGITVAVHEWRGNDTSSLRPSRRCDWGYRELVQVDMPASLAAARAASPGLRWLIGGHSLGGQLAAIEAGLHPDEFAGLVLVATGVPAYRLFPPMQRAGVYAFSLLVPVLTRIFGMFPGDRLNWAGKEAATLMRQWAGTARRGDYRGVGLDRDAEHVLGDWRGPVLGLGFSEDWLASDAALDALIDKLGSGHRQRERFDRAALGDTADHFRWMKSPDAVAAAVSAWSAAQSL
jgi:predicted alpha/beta hydrolase